MVLAKFSVSCCFRHCLILLTVATALSSFASVQPSPPAYGIRMEDTWIPMKDGVRLAVKLYMPDGAKAGDKFPAVLEYHPYRKDDGTAARDYPLYAYFARRGYVCARVDIRGFGGSEGVPTDREYSEQEQLDASQIIAWLAHQPWSNGSVGMMGISWSGFNSLQMAMRHAPELKAIIAVDATAELFHDDVHYMDGIAHVDEFELNMDMAPGITGAPDYTLDEKVLGPRFETPPWSLLYFKHQRDGPFWRSPVRPYSEIKIPCFIIGGLLDGYRDSVTDMLEQTKAPLKAIMGPWNHNFRTMPCLAHRSSGATRLSAGGITGSRAVTPACFKTLSSSFTCSTGILRIRLWKMFRESGVAKKAGRHAMRMTASSTHSRITL